MALRTNTAATTISRDGRHFTGGAGGTYGVWSTTAPSLTEEAATDAHVPPEFPRSMALNRDGTESAVSDGGPVYLTPVAARGQTRNGPIALTGTVGTITGGLRCLGDGGRLLSASGSTVAVWDLNRVDLLAQNTPTADLSSCNACSGARVAVAPDGQRVALLDGDSVVVQAIAPPRSAALRLAVRPYVVAAPVWLPDGTLVVPAGETGPPSAESVPGVNVVTWSTGISGEAVVSSATSDGRVVLVTPDGEIHVFEGRSGRRLDTLSSTPDLPPETEALASNRDSAAISPDGNRVAVTGGSAVVLTDLRTRDVLTRVPGEASDVVFGGRRLLVQRNNGTLEIWDDHARVLERTIPGDSRYVSGPVVDLSGTLAAEERRPPRPRRAGHRPAPRGASGDCCGQPDQDGGGLRTIGSGPGDHH